MVPSPASATEAAKVAYAITHLTGLALPVSHLMTGAAEHHGLHCQLPDCGQP